MKITVCFNSVRVIVPCGNGDLSVEELTQRAIARYKKATNKNPDETVQVQALETIDERAILDPDDVVSDVLDDKDKVVAVFDEQTASRPVLNSGDGMSVSSVGTASPDIFQSEVTNFHNSINSNNNLVSIKDENHNDTKPSKLVVVSSSIHGKHPPPPVAPKPKGYKKKDSHALQDSFPSEDSGICVTRNRLGSDSSKSELSEVSPRVIRTAETAFVAIGTPIQINKQFDFNGKTSNESQKDFEDDQEEETFDDDDGTFSLGRNSARQSMFVDNPVLDRWAELQHKRMLDDQDSGRVSVEEREDPAGASMSPTEERTFDNNLFGNDKLDGVESICSGESDDVLTISLQPETPGDLGFRVAGYKTADGRELGLIVREISSYGCAAKDGQLQIADRILDINGKHLADMSNQRAEEIFAQESKAPLVKLMVSGAHSFVNENKQNVNETIQKPEEIEQQQALPTQAMPSEDNGIEPPPGFRDMRRSHEPQLSTSIKKVNKRFLIELNKGSDGLGFSITTRDNPAGGNTPIFVKGILAKGAAIEDGQLKSGDQIVEVNGTEMSGRSQGEAVNILRSTRGLVKLLIQREEIIQAPTKPAVEVNEESTRFLRGQGKHVLTFKIPLSNSGAAGLGISVKGKANGDSPQDKGIYVKSVIAGGAAQKDGRLQADDQLLSVNNVSFLGLPNGEAIEKLRTAMQTTRLGQAFIEVTIARLKDDDTESLHKVQQESEQEERPIEAGIQETASNEPIEKTLQEPMQNGYNENESQSSTFKSEQNVPEHPEQEPQSFTVTDGPQEEEDDDFNAKPLVPLNLSSSKIRNPVQRNESYCVAIRGPFQKRPMRASPLLAKGPETFEERPSSTVAMPTPSCSTDGQSKGRNPTPVPPPRGDSFNNATMANLHIHKHISSSSVNGKYSLTNGSQAAPPSPTRQNVEPNASRRSYNRLPSYEQTIERLRSRSGGSEEGREELQDSQDVVFSYPDIISDSPFEREGFGRQSMSEKKARSSVDAKKTQMYQIREKQKEMNKNSKRPLSENHPVNGLNTPLLRKAKSEGHMQTNIVKGGKSPTSENRHMWKSTSESSLKSNESEVRKASTSNLSFRNAMEGPAAVPNGVMRPSQSEDQEIPITMTSKADFNAVQQKLAKKPFYRKFKIGKTRRGEYSLTDAERSPKHSLYGQEALIDFPSEQRYRQLVSHYDDDVNNRSSSLPNRRRLDQTDGNPEQHSNVKIGRVIVSEPTRV